MNAVEDTIEWDEWVPPAPEFVYAKRKPIALEVRR
jgi:hypothetical protein